MTINKGLFSSANSEWSTPQEFFDKLNDEFHFTLDPCASPNSAKCNKYYTPSDDGLIQDWGGEVVFCNPPYGREIANWVRKCREESWKPNTKVVMLVPARTDTQWFHQHIYNKAEIRFIKGRLRFGGGSTPAPFPSMIVIF